MKKKIFTTLGLMSGTSMDGVDLSLIKSDGYNHIEQIYDKYCEFNEELFTELFTLRDDLKNSNNLRKNSVKIDRIEKKFTLFNAKIVSEFLDETNYKPDLIGFHGQTIFHNVKEKISKQIGDGHLLSQLTKCSVVNKFRQLDLENNGQGAPLTPIFHYLISQKIKDQFSISFPINFVNIGGITNVTLVLNNHEIKQDIFAYDIAPGNCLIDQWLRKSTDKRFDNNGSLAESGKINELVLNQAKDNFEITSIKESLDINDFDINFVKGLNLEDGCATLTEFTAYLISQGLKKIDKINNINTKNFIICGGGRKNKTLLKKISQYLDNDLNIRNIDEFNINGDFVESQAFGYLAIRSFLNLPISFPNTTRCKKPCSGGEIIKNF
ncbi:anhydro-N-acetylmuramic acid kinase [Candidatus Pelagibacter sp.]|nr:anhydro-N-acetylmuramic acid kinase [Candidatus Pelagibacter sp.]MDC3135556.1 anhydro-N-acetylmuramic acid kinase [Candidatus Pelagibacter sp.]